MSCRFSASSALGLCRWFKFLDHSTELQLIGHTRLCFLLLFHFSLFLRYFLQVSFEFSILFHFCNIISSVLQNYFLLLSLFLGHRKHFQLNRCLIYEKSSMRKNCEVMTSKPKYFLINWLISQGLNQINDCLVGLKWHKLWLDGFVGCFYHSELFFSRIFQNTKCVNNIILTSELTYGEYQVQQLLPLSDCWPWFWQLILL